MKKVIAFGKEILVPRKSRVSDILKIADMSIEGVYAVRQYFANDERQRFWPLHWNEEIDSIEDGDQFEIVEFSKNLKNN